MSERAEFHVMGQPFDGKPLHYTASGLNYVYLLNGFNVENDPDYGQIITIQDEDSLHCAIGLYVIMQPRVLSGPEFRFLRKQMGLKQKDLAEEFGVSEQTVANYEKQKPIPTASDHLMRMFFLVSITPEEARADLLKRIVDGIKKRPRNPKPPTVSATPPADIQAMFGKQWQMSGSGAECGVM